MKKGLLCSILSAMLIMSFTACSQQESHNNESKLSENDVNSSDTSGKSDSSKDSGYDLSFSKRDVDSSYSESSATKITFSKSSVESSSDSVNVSGTQVTITKEGTYIL